jgi:transcriptional regulator with XRE-family HTH domain
MRKPNVNSRLARARAVTGLDQSAFAELVGISEPQLAHMERGGKKGRPLTPDVAAKIAVKTGISAYWLLGGGDFKTPLALDGEEYTQLKFDSAKLLATAVQLGAVVADLPEVSRFKHEREVLMARRANAWKEYLSGMLGEVFDNVRDHDPGSVEAIGTELLSALWGRSVSPVGGKLKSVDEVMRSSKRR